MSDLFRKTFSTPYEQFHDRNGEPFVILRVIDEPDQHHDPEVLPMYEILFADGTIIDAWPEEVEQQNSERG